MNTSAPVAPRGRPSSSCRSSSARDGVADLELHGRADRHRVADGHGAGLPVGAEHAADEEVAALEVELALVDHDAAVQALLAARARSARG